MRADPAANSAAAEQLLRPAYWLIWGRDWPGDTDVAEAAVALAPGLIPRADLSYSAFQVLGCADVYARKSGLRVIFFSDLTRQLAKAAESWNGLHVDWSAALQEIESGPLSGVFLAVSERAYQALCDPVSGTALEDRRHLRQVFVQQLEASWSDYVQHQIEAGRFRVAI